MKMKPLIGKKCKEKGSLVPEALIPNMGGTPKGSILGSFKIRENNLKEVGEKKLYDECFHHQSRPYKAPGALLRLR